MSDATTYRAVLIGPDLIGAGEEIELEYVNGALQDRVVRVFVEEDGEAIEHVWVLGDGRDEPIPYRFVAEADSDTTPNVKN